MRIVNSQLTNVVEEAWGTKWGGGGLTILYKKYTT